MLSFLIPAAILVLAAGLLSVLPLLGGRRKRLGQDAMDTQVFRDQLEELDRDLVRGTINAAEAEGARTEIARRLLTATQRAQNNGALSPAPASRSSGVAAVSLLVVPLAAAALYSVVGAPGQSDAPYAARDAERRAAAQEQSAPRRPTQLDAEAAIAASPAEQTPPPAAADPQYLTLVEQLRTVVANRPDDPEGHRLLANALMRIGRWAEGWRIQERLIALMGADATADQHAAQAEAMVMAAGGYVSPAAEAVIGRALTLDRSSALGRFYGGLALRQAGRIDAAIGVWEDLRADAPQDAPYLPFVDEMLAETRRAQGSEPGPTREDIEAASRMTDQDRSAMIEGMVAGLEERLTGSGGDVEEWVRLMNAYTRLNRKSDAQRVFALALSVQGDATARSFLREKALLMGLDIE
ncbi:MAG: c-type cytochrome biogenesis protein CcmI [Pseudomonadota bacterium]